MEEDDFGDLYGDQTPGFSSIGDGSLQKTYPGYAIYDNDDDDEDEGFAVTPAFHSHPPHGSSNPHGPSKLPEVRRYPDWPAERDSDEDDDMLLLGYNSKSGSASGKIQSSMDAANNLQVAELENLQEGFPELAEPARVQNITYNGAISPSAGSNRAVTGYLPGDMPKQDIDLAGHNPLDDPNRSPDVGDLTNHTLTIPGLSTTMNASPFDMGNNGDVTEDVWEQRQGAKAHLGTDRDAAAEGAEDWDTDSEDDLRIVLNTEYPYYPSGDKARVGRYEGGSEDEDEDLIIVAGGEPVEEGEEQSLQPPDVQAAPGDGSIHPAGDKQAGDVDEKGQQDKVVSGVATLGQSVSRVGYGYHSYNSPYKYVRPGAAPLYGTGVAPAGQAPGSRVSLLKGVNGRGDWRGPARGSYGPQATSQLSLWATQSGYEYTLPSSMTVFDIDLEAFDEKPWRQSAIAIDVTDFFNFGFDETTWKDYCKQLAQLRLESTMQSKIRVYESGRSEQEYDPDLPPELAVAAGLHEVSDRNQRRLSESEATATAMGRRGHTPMIPLGRPIEVEGGLGDRRPSSDLRKQRIRDSDSIILIDAMEEEELEAQRLHGENTRGMGGEADKEDEMDEEEEEEEEQQQEEEEEEHVVEVTKSTFKPQQQMWRKEQMFGSKNHVSRGEIISPTESSQKISEERLRTGFNPSAFSTDQNMQAHPLAGKPIATESGKFSGESISATHRETSSRLRTASKLLVEERRDSDQIPSQSGGLCQDAESSPKSLNDDGESHVKKHTCKEEQIQSQEGSHAGDDVSPNKHQTDRSTGQRVSDLNATTSREVFTQDNVPQEVQANSPECSSKRQRLVSPEGSHTASWDNYDVQKSTRSVVSKKESRDSGESAQYGQEDGSQYRKNHKSYSDMSRGDQHRGSREGSDSHRKKQAFTLGRHDLENEIHSYADNLQETRKRPKQGIMEKDTEKELSRHWNDRGGDVYAQSKGREEEAGRRGYLAKEVVHYKEKTGNQPESRKKDEEDRAAAYYKDRGGNRPESRKKDEEDREAAYYKDRGGNRPESRKREEEDRRDRQASRKRDVEDRRDRLDRGFQHREKEVEPLNWRSSERKKREEEYRRRDWSEEAGGHDKKEKEKHLSERHDRDFDQHLRRKEEESWKRERPEDHHRSKARDGSLRDKEDPRQRNGEYQDPHGRAYKDEERAAQVGRSSKRHDEDRSWRGREESRVSERTRSAEPRSYTKDKRKDLDDYGKDKSRSHEGSARSVSDREGLHLLESRGRDSGKHGRLSDDLRTSERRLHLDKHRSDAKRSKDSDKETNDSASQLGEYSNASRKRKAASDKYETAIRKGLEDPLTSRTRDSQASVTRAHPKETKEERNFQGAEKGSSEDDERQKGRSKLERWMSHKDLEFDASARLPSDVKLKKDEKHRQSSVFREKQQHDPSKLHDDSDQENQQLAGIDRKAGNASVIEEQVNGKVPKPNEKGDPIVQSKEVHADTEDTDYVELPEHHQHDPALPRTNMAVKLEKRKERFKVSVEERDLLKRLDYEDHQLMDKDESRQERPPRKRRWASG